jgi:23S rRNA (cytidine1920-2'-O)/16S rRNA (cytidine1409-2'-O)-methyltransferase
LDKLLIDRGITQSRERAQALILAGKVLVDDHPAIKAGQKVSADSRLRLRGEDIPYVSRGGLKLEHAIKTFSIVVENLVAMDVGASTGGFTDCLLQHGARRVYAVDVGYGQLAWKLRQDPRVVPIERHNIRYLPAEMIPEPVQIATVDASFISLKLVIPAVLPFLDHDARMIVLIKPQFEAGKDKVGKGGVVKDTRIHEAVCDSIASYCTELKLGVTGITPSPVLGPKGNREFLMVAEYSRRVLDPEPAGP